MKKRIASIALSLAMCLTLLPTAAYAEDVSEGGGPLTASQAQVTVRLLLQARMKLLIQLRIRLYIQARMRLLRLSVKLEMATNLIMLSKIIV